MKLFFQYIIILCGLISSISLFASKSDTQPEHDFVAQNFPLKTPSKWTKGEPFIYTSKELNIILKKMNPVYGDTTNYLGKTFLFDSFKQHTDWNGNTTLDLIFSADGEKIRFETGKSLQQLSDSTYNPLIPGLIWMGEIYKADSLLRNKTLFIRTSDWDTDNEENLQFARKFVPVTITKVEAGNEILPVRIYFKDDKERPYSILTTLSGTLNSSSKNTFEKIFTFSDPKLGHKEILPEVWKAICAGKLIIGMTQNEVRLSIGRPTEIKRIPTYSGMHEQWSYSSGTMIYFQDGRITKFRQ